jgi:hypothetical protein
MLWEHYKKKLQLKIHSRDVVPLKNKEPEMPVKQEIIPPITTAILNTSYLSPPSYMYQANVSSGANNTLLWTTRIM